MLKLQVNYFLMKMYIVLSMLMSNIPKKQVSEMCQLNKTTLLAKIYRISVFKRTLGECKHSFK